MTDLSNSVSIRDLSLSFGAVTVLQNLDLDIKDGEFLVLLGSSGCGKSTLLNCIAGLLEPTDGQIFIKDRNVTWEEPKDRGIGMVFQSYALYPQMTVEKNLSFGLKVAGMPKDEIEKRIARAAGILQIEPLLQRKPAALSGGQRQRVAIGRALVRDVDVFLFDEPLSNLDAKLRSELRVEIKRLHQSLKNTMIYVTHDQIEAMTLATKIVVLKEGIVQQVGTPAEIYNRPANLFVADFMGSPAMNMLKGTAVAGGIQLFGAGGQGVTVKVPPSVTSAIPEGKQVILGLRPEAISDEGSADANAAASARIDADVTIVEPTGSDTFVTGKLDGTTFTGRARAETMVEPGQSFRFVFNLDKAVVFDPETGKRID